MSRPPTRKGLALLCIVIAATANALMLLFAKLAAESTGLAAIVCIRYLLTTLVILVTIAISSRRAAFPAAWHKTRWGLHLARGVAGYVSLLAYFVCAKLVSLVDANVLYNTSPLWVPLLVLWGFHIKITGRLWWGMIIGFIGVILVIQPGSEIFNWASLVGLFSGIIAAVAFILLRQILYSDSRDFALLTYSVVGAILSFATALFWGGFIGILTWPTWLYALLVGCFGYFFQLFLTAASQHAAARFTTPFLYVGVVLSALLDWFVFSIGITILTIIGIVLILLSTISMAWLYPKDDLQPSNKL